ncbi:hypothetical protein ScPMuIL_013433 [Solemya velum]
MTTEYRIPLHRNSHATWIRTFRNLFDRHRANKCEKNKLTGKSVLIGFISLISILVASYVSVSGFAKKAKNRRLGVEEINNSIYGLLTLYRYQDYVIPGFMLKYVDDSGIEDFQVRSDDIFVVTFPRSGTTLTMEMTYLIASDLDFQKAKQQLLAERVRFLENPHDVELRTLDQLPSPRVIKTHLPLQLLPKQVRDKSAKVIYVARNPKDVVVSLYYFTKLMKPMTKFDGPLEQCFEAFVNDEVFYSPWWRHVREFWEIREQDNVLFLKYEDIVQNTEDAVRSIASFLGKNFSQEEIEQVAKHCKFSNMKQNSSTNYSHAQKIGFLAGPGFIRKGKVGDWRNHLSQEMCLAIDQMVEERLQNSGLEFDYGNGQDSIH